MDLREGLEIYIPVEAEVKSVPLWSLPNSVLRRMHPQTDRKASRKLTEAPEVIWICPLVLRKKGQKLASSARNNVIENMSSMAKEVGAALNPVRMSFVSSNRLAYKVLKDTKPGKNAPHFSLLPLGSAPQACQDAVFIYRGCVYLSVRKTSRSQKIREAAAASQFASTSTSDMQSKSQKRQFPQASPEPADKELQRKRSHITLPQIPHKQTQTHQELLNDNSPMKKHTTCKVTHVQTRKDVSSSKTACSVHPSTDSVHSHCYKDAKGEQHAGAAGGPGPAWFQPWEEQEEQVEVANNDSGIQDQADEDAESSNQNDDIESDVKVKSSESSDTVGLVEQPENSNQSWTRRESEAASYAPTSFQQESDFSALEQEEKIAKLKAKLRKSEMDLDSLN